MDETEEHGRETQPVKDEVSEDVIHLPERDLNSVAHVASPRLVHPEQMTDFRKQVIEDDSSN
ncbi:MAG: hypothetical protein QOH41_204 [Blastocatellia bacterium]|nr:hypothetical protein [Blastocatellia bacterium]